MPRLSRKNLNTSYYHIIVQGINKEYIFDKERYIKKYHNLIINNLKKYDLKIIAYCIMSNHAHLLLYAEKTETMAEYMKSINTSYARYYNRNENRVGIVFRNRYESEPIYNQRYLLNCIAYIHNNPVKAKIVDSVERYKYSSYKDYIYLQGIVTEETIEQIFGCIEDYIDTYKEIHKKSYDFKDCIEDIDYTDIYNNLKKMDINHIVSNKDKLKETVFKLIEEHKMPINKVSELLGISRFKVSRIKNGRNMQN